MSLPHTSMADPLDPFTLWQTDYANISAEMLVAIDHEIRVEFGLGTCSVFVGFNQRWDQFTADPAIAPPTPPDEHNNLPTQSDVQMEPVEGSGFAPEQDVPSIPLNVYQGPIEDAVYVSLVSGLRSSSMSVHRSFLWLMLISFLEDFVAALAGCPSWKQIFLDIFREHWFWLATVSTTPPVFKDLLVEALQRRSVHPGSSFENGKFQILRRASH